MTKRHFGMHPFHSLEFQLNLSDSLFAEPTHLSRINQPSPQRTGLHLSTKKYSSSDRFNKIENLMTISLSLFQQCVLHLA